MANILLIWLFEFNLCQWHKKIQVYFTFASVLDIITMKKCVHMYLTLAICAGKHIFLLVLYFTIFPPSIFMSQTFDE